MMKKFVLILSFVLSQSLWANLHLSPPSFNVGDKRAIFVDFKSAHYRIHFVMGKKVAMVVSSIEFEATEEGYPIFDLVPDVTKISINDIETSAPEVSLPGNASVVRMAQQPVKPGKHRMVITHRLEKNLKFHRRHVRLAFWIRDLKDRLFMEQYIPSNLEFDQYKMTVDLIFEGLKDLNQDIYANGDVTRTSQRSYRIEYPDFYTASAPYLHVTRKGRMRRKDFTVKSISGREVPVTVYSRLWIRTKKFEKEVKKVFVELENDYGPYAHKSLIAFGEGFGGMEHAGATQTSFGALDHEMLHFYFAKGIFPANGNSGWMDEAIARWRDDGYPTRPSISFQRSGIAGHSVYQRNTDSRSYGMGAEVMSHLDFLLSNTGGLRPFLKGYFEAYKFQVVNTDHFINNLEFFTGLNLRPLLEQHVYEKPGKKTHQHVHSDPVHVEMTEQDYLDLL